MDAANICWNQQPQQHHSSPVATQCLLSSLCCRLTGMTSLSTYNNPLRQAYYDIHQRFREVEELIQGHRVLILPQKGHAIRSWIWSRVFLARESNHTNRWVMG